LPFVLGMLPLGSIRFRNNGLGGGIPAEPNPSGAGPDPTPADLEAAQAQARAKLTVGGLDNGSISKVTPKTIGGVPVLDVTFADGNEVYIPLGGDGTPRIASKWLEQYGPSATAAIPSQTGEKPQRFVPQIPELYVPGATGSNVPSASVTPSFTVQAKELRSALESKGISTNGLSLVPDPERPGLYIAFGAGSETSNAGYRMQNGELQQFDETDGLFRPVIATSSDTAGSASTVKSGTAAVVPSDSSGAIVKSLLSGTPNSGSGSKLEVINPNVNDLSGRNSSL
jgi:hypothetical protein